MEKFIAVIRDAIKAKKVHINDDYKTDDSLDFYSDYNEDECIFETRCSACKKVVCIYKADIPEIEAEGLKKCPECGVVFGILDCDED